MFTRTGSVAILTAILFGGFQLGLATSSATAQDLKLRANLTGSTSASGSAKFEQKGTIRKFSAEVEDAARNTTMRVFYRRGTQAAVLIGSITTNAQGIGDLNLQGQTIPALRVNDRILVRNPQNQTILSGQFQPD